MNITSPHLPILKHNDPIGVSILCTHSAILWLQLNIDTDLQQDVRIFQTRWSCKDYQIGKKLRWTFKLTLPANLRYRPSFVNSMVLVENGARLHVISMKKEKWHNLGYIQVKNRASEGTVLRTINVKITDPFIREKLPLYCCFTWWTELKMQIRQFSPICLFEEGKNYLILFFLL